jgi:hypothetical protein
LRVLPVNSSTLIAIASSYITAPLSGRSDCE